jgi:CRISP-associated protein Cas1
MTSRKYDTTSVKVDLCPTWAYGEQCKLYRSLADNVSSSTFVLNGYNCSLRVLDGALAVRPGSVSGESHDPLLFYRGTNGVKQIVITSNSGNISLDALYWCRDQGISLLLLDGHGNQVYSIVPESKDAAPLRRLQYLAGDNGKGARLAQEILRAKTVSQYDTVQRHSELNGREHLLDILEGAVTELGQDDYRFRDMDCLRAYEGRLAAAYFDAFLGLPIRWNAADAKKVPPHWKAITERSSPLSSNARYAINPFHAALNYMYTVVEHQILCSIHTVGLDPSCGFLHADKVNRDSLVYDLIEPLRPQIDDEVLSFFSKVTLKRGDLILHRSGQVFFNAEFARYLLASCSMRSWNGDSVVSWFKSSLEG